MEYRGSNYYFLTISFIRLLFVIFIDETVVRTKSQLFFLVTQE